MGQVIDFRPTPAPGAPDSQVLHRCARCGADLWNILADGRVRCADCEEECTLRTTAGSGTGNGREYEANRGE
jgi:hypothetical protein